MRIALVGDVLISREIGPAGLQALRDVTEALRRADVVIGNLESVVHDYQYPPGPPSVAGWTHCPPAAVPDLRAVGLTAVSRANNHAGDWGQAGWERTSDELERVGLVHAGIGRSYRDALAAEFATTGTGRIALLAVTTTSPDHAIAADGGDGILPRPGVAHVKVDEWFETSGQVFDSLRELAFGFNVSSSNQHVDIGQIRFSPGVQARRRSRCDPDQLDDLILAVRQASCTADVVVVSVHSHQHGGQLHEPPEALAELAHAVVAAGADIVACHGPHVLRHIEQTDRAIIAFGLGNFIFQPDDIPRVPLEGRRLAGVSARALPQVACMRTMDWDAEPRFWHSAIVTCDIPDTEEAVSVEIEPLYIRRGGRAFERGLPRLAVGAERDKIAGQVAVVRPSDVGEADPRQLAPSPTRSR